MGSMIDNQSLQAARLALNGLSLRQQVISRNVANVDTPGYQSQDINFEQAVQHASKEGGTALAIGNQRCPYPTHPDEHQLYKSGPARWKQSSGRQRRGHRQ